MSSDLPELARMIGRLERSIEDGQKENGRRFDIINQKQADQQLAIGRVAEKQNELEQRMLRAESAASAATRSASESKAEIGSVKDAMVKHMRELEKTMHANREKSDERNDSQDVMLREILEGQKRAEWAAKAKSEVKLEQEAAAAAEIVRAREAEEYRQAQLEKKLTMMFKVGGVAVPFLSAIGGAIAWLLTHW